MNILIIYPNSFPVSTAATNRIISISKGLIDQKNKVFVLINRPTESKKNQVNYDFCGVYEGIHFEYATNNLIWPSKKINKIICYFHGLINTLYKVYKNHKKGKIDLIISAATTGYTENLLYSKLAKLIGVKIVHTLDEYPWVLINKEIYPKFYINFYLKNFYKLFDGYIIMTKVLMSFYKKVASKKAKFVHIPMSVELERFYLKRNNEINNYIAYCGGDKSGTKDGVDILIKAFNIIKDDFPKLKLYIIGPVHNLVKNIAKDLKLLDRIKFIGFVERDNVPYYLVNSEALCLSRPNNLQADGGFPTKLGEYLASSRPVIVTKVGEITDYLEQRKSAFLVEPGNINDFAEKIRYVLTHKDESENIGLTGRNIAKQYFFYKNQGVKLNDFLSKLIMK